MSARIRQHIRNNVYGLIAIFIALSGTAYAVDGPLAGQNQVGSADIIDGEVKTEDIRDANVGLVDLKAGSVNSSKLVDGEVRSVDVLDNGLTGADIDESSLDSASLGFECPAGYELAGNDVCYGGAQSNENFNTALSTCAGNGDRLPTLAEGWAVIADLPDPAEFAFQQTWTADQSSGAAQAIFLTKNFQGTISRGTADVITPVPFRCVTSPHG